MKNAVTRKIAVAILVSLGILLLVFLGREIAIRFFDYTPPAISESQQKKVKQVDVSINHDETYQHTVADKYIYFVTTDKIRICDNGGKLKNEVDIITGNPVIKTSGKYVLVADTEGKNAYLLNGEKLKNTIETKGEIVDFSVNSEGYTVLITEGDMHKRDVTVYDTKGKEQFVWNSGSMFVLNAVIADNNKNIVMSILDTQEGKMKTVLSFYNISNPEPIATETYEDELIASLEVCGNYVYCVGDSKTLIYRVSGKKSSEILYGGKSLVTYETSNSNIVLAFSESALSGKRYNIETYNHSAKQIGKYEVDSEIKFIDYAEDTIAVSRGRLINIVDISGREKKLLDPGIDINSISFIGTTTQAVGFTADGAYIFSTK